MDSNLFTATKRTAIFLLLILFSISFLPQIRIKSIFSSIYTLSYDSKDTKDNVSNPFLRIAIIGSSGYIGARLLDHLRTENNWNVTGYDRIFPGQASYQISTNDLRKFHVIIYLGGLTGRVMCQNRPNDVQRENIDDISTLTTRMLPSQMLIFASTSAIAEGSGSVPLAEDSPIQTNLLDLYTHSLLRREEALRLIALSNKKTPRMIGLRFGTVVGLSLSQRTDLSVMALVCQAFLTGRLHISHPEANRAFLHMDDLLRAVTTIIKRSKQIEQFDIFHLQSFSATISNIANSIASLTGAHISAEDHLVSEDTRGFSIKNTKFRTTFNFVFEDNQDKIISQLIDDVPRMCLGRQSRVDNNSMPCVVCGSRTMYTILDLHSQPLANDFNMKIEDSLNSKRFPLRLVRCPICHHAQLSHTVDRKHLFSHYLYQSGTSNSIKVYFAWLAEKVINETRIVNGTVLEIACNDGSQLNEFLKRGWKTVGVDPAKNLADIARTAGHTVYTGFWGVDNFPTLPSFESLNVIIAQNVLAHVDNPIQFLRACTVIMGPQTKLYIQTSQCEMYETGQFDTVYHEHISFFTAHSFQKLASIVGLTVVRFEITTIHGHSCLVTFQRTDLSKIDFPTRYNRNLAPSLSFALEKERNLGITDPWFYMKYEAQAKGMREWITHQLTSLQAQNHTIAAYGAAAKGMVLLHFLLEITNRSWNISYVVDDASLKQNTYCPGTSIPVRPTSHLNKHNSVNPLTIIVFAWNFADEIVKKIRSETIDKGIKNVFVILPFPHQQLIKIEQNRDIILVQNSNKPLPWPLVFLPTRRPVILISHFFNEEFLLPYWIRHHAPMFDMAILIDYNSTDQSLEIIRREAPQTWKVVSSRNAQFEAALVDAEVADYEKMYLNAWKIALTTTEFLVHSNLREMLAKKDQHNQTAAFRFRSFTMSGNDSIPLKRFTSLLKQRSQYTYNPLIKEEMFGNTLYSRFIHCYPSVKYQPGRHMILDTAWEWVPIGFVAKYQLAPWPEIINRKLQIRARVPVSEFHQNFGTHHNINLDQLKRIKQLIETWPQNDLRNFTAASEEFAMANRLWKEIIDQ
jgi:nucleoside-diphosphate-sugar epimerase/2-polyprenyl-3-methyl-5-hydroxy-6-metoxy-1,4-benzoquinol methylase